VQPYLEGKENMNKVLNVTETARLLDTDNTYVYKLIKNNQLEPVQDNPYRLDTNGVKEYLNKRLPHAFSVFYNKPAF
jgi:hypothetical protein